MRTSVRSLGGSPALGSTCRNSSLMTCARAQTASEISPSMTGASAVSMRLARAMARAGSVSAPRTASGKQSEKKQIAASLKPRPVDSRNTHSPPERPDSPAPRGAATGVVSTRTGRGKEVSRRTLWSARKQLSEAEGVAEPDRELGGLRHEGRSRNLGRLAEGREQLVAGRVLPAIARREA